MARTGGLSGTTSGDLFLAFSTVVPEEAGAGHQAARFVDSLAMNPLIEATAHATEEAIINSLVAGRTMAGVHGNVVPGLPHDRLQSILKAHGRLVPPPAAATTQGASGAPQCATR
jgi:L-aminopeptidase/D-esterase-like protein